MSYSTTTWSIAGEHTYENEGFTLLNPQMTIRSITVNVPNNYHFSLNMTEDGGVFKHNYWFNYTHDGEETDLEVIALAAMASKFPTATTA